MWLFTDFGFFSIVQKPGSPDLTVRSRVRGDLDRFRAVVPGLGETIVGGGTDYEFRAVISHQDFAAGAGNIITGVDYSNFKSRVRQSLPGRGAILHSVWSALHGLAWLPDISAGSQPGLWE